MLDDSKPRDGLHGVDVGDTPTLRSVRVAKSLWLLLSDPQAWSARRYRNKNSLELTALHPERWR